MTACGVHAEAVQPAKFSNPASAGENVPPRGHPDPEEPTMTSPVTLRNEGPMIVATVLLPDCAPDRALSAFTDPTVVSQWWRGELTTNLEPGCTYQVAFPAINAALEGRVVSYDPARSLEFTWAWESDDGPPSTVIVRAEPATVPSSTLLTITHGPHSDDERGKQSHQEHWEGWDYFLPRLAIALSG
jgi:uncharacterized protein YndB with AHSA1/START domain